MVENNRNTLKKKKKLEIYNFQLIFVFIVFIMS